MARKRKGTPIHGWLAIDKPLGMSSSQVVGKVKWLLKAAKVGHGGTLDPLATGVLPIALGEATKTVSYVMDGTKTYRFQIRWGEATATLDREGEVTATSAVRPDPAAILAALPAFIGAIEQSPPAFSAIKVDGVRAYDLARAGEEVEMKSRTVRIDSFTLLDMPDADHADFQVVCGKGTYIRSLARDLSLALGTLGHVSVLRRAACGPFREESAISLETLAELGHGPGPWAFMLPIETALDDIPALALTESEARRLQSGCPVSVMRVAPRHPEVSLAEGTVCRAMLAERLVALARIDGDDIRPVRVMNLENEGVNDVDHA
ncbi:tRNA pseudouridine(55) synthase TruB [Paramagnetospirillum kuznetsovii]|uniref:tRNA pseudouridine synthase B n=1 Tax=Paramagnetospirillum kuznetsovii TaxID=2053833 RepID=A0A364NXW2_9PROT|nr:tRNA pseudouridine(55) synthase TruB [Paramagnetospirillum kuznetsovii]RAU21921.1 tRNA pseudouridine(55) synthase TruB [Paramagnetospirillum kuznetsovii]